MKLRTNGIRPRFSVTDFIGNHRPHWPRREKRGETGPPPALSGTLAAFRAAALWAVTVLILAASGAAFAESYQGLYEWARHHGKTGIWATLYPLQIDVFIAVPELVLFIAMLDGWKGRHKAGAWLLALAGLSASIAGNVGHSTASDLQSRGTAAVPPLAAFAALWLGFTVVKRIIERRAELAQLTAAAMSLPEIPTDNEVAALMALRATTYAGNPLSGRQLETQFGLSRAQATRVRQAVLAQANGHAAVNGSPDADQ